MISSSKNVIKAWSPEKVRDFIPPLTASKPVIRELDRRDLDQPVKQEQAVTEEEFYIDEELKALRAMEEAAREADEKAELALKEAQEQAEKMLEAARAVCAIIVHNVTLRIIAKTFFFTSVTSLSKSANSDLSKQAPKTLF